MANERQSRHTNGKHAAASRWQTLAALLLCLLVTLLAAPATFAQRLTLTNSHASYQPLRYLQHSCAPEALPLEQLLAPTNNTVWRAGRLTMPAISLTANTCWFRLPLSNHSKKRWFLHLPSARSMQVGYQLIDDHGRQLLDAMPPSKAGASAPSTSVALPLPRGKNATLYLRVSGNYGRQLPVSINDAQAMARANLRTALLQGLFYGALLIMLLYNLLLFLSLRETAYLLYVCWSAILITFWFLYNGLAQQYLWPTLPHLSTQLLAYCFPFMIFLPAWFSLEFLALKQRAPKLRQLLGGNIWVGLLLLAATPFISPRLLLPIDVAVLLLATSLLLLTVLLRLFYRHNNASYLALAWLALLAGIVAICLDQLGLVTLNSLVAPLAQACSLLSIALLSLALSQRISHLKKAHIQLREAQNQTHIEALRATAMNQAKGRFLDTISQQVRAPMQQVLGLVELIEQTPLDAQQQNYIRSIGRSSQQMLREVNDIIDYSHIREGKLHLNIDEFSLEQLLDDCINAIATQANAKQLAIYLYIDRQLPSHFVGDAVRIRQLIGNLLDNAVKFTQEGKVSLHVNQQQAKDLGGNCLLRFEVADTGCGISKQQQTQLFSDVMSGDANSDHSTTISGLGLVICEALSRSMRGRLAVKSAPGRGSTFSVHLPLKVGAGLAPTLAGHQLTLVSRNDFLALSLSQLVERWGMHFVHIQDPHLLEASPAQLVLIDGDLPIAHAASLEPLAERHQLALLRGHTMTPALTTIPRQLSRPLVCGALFNLCRHASHQATGLQAPAPTDQSVTSIHALIVSSSQLTRMLLDNILHQQHISASIYSGETDAGFWQKATSSYQLLLIDDEHQQDPLGLVKRIKETGRLQKGPEPWAILIAPHLPMNVIEKARASGVDDFLLKPVTPEQLLRLLGTAGFLKRRAEDRLPTTDETAPPDASSAS